MKHNIIYAVVHVIKTIFSLSACGGFREGEGGLGCHTIMIESNGDIGLRDGGTHAWSAE